MSHRYPITDGAACSSSSRSSNDLGAGGDPPDLAAPSTTEDLAGATVRDLAMSSATMDLATARDLRPASPPDLAGTPPTTGQCWLTSQCPQANPSASCNADAPLGICGCGADTAYCNAGWDDECVFGSCVRTCSVDGDCGPSRTCTLTGRCAIKSCSQPSDCSPLHTCRGTLCGRVQCPNGQGDCPANTTCRTTSGGKLCVENAYFP